jgi:mycothiol S-conjugate amidase
VRSFRPHVMTTYNEEGGYPHPDHIMTHKVSMEAFEAAGDPDRYEGSGDPWQPLKLYYDVGFSRPRMTAMHEALLARGMESPFKDWLERWEDRPDRQVTTRIVCGEWFDRRDQALLSHATQIDPDGWFFSIPREIQAQVWPTEDYELARTLVTSEIPEDDLFAGIRDRVVV